MSAATISPRLELLDNNQTPIELSSLETAIEKIDDFIQRSWLRYVLPIGARPAKEAALRSWQEVFAPMQQEENPSIQEAQERLKALLLEKKFPSWCFKDELEKDVNHGLLRKRAEFFSTLTTVQAVEDLKKASPLPIVVQTKGTKGPSFVVSLPKEQFFLKYLDVIDEEILTQSYFGAFKKVPDKDGALFHLGLETIKSASFDFEDNLYRSVHGTTSISGRLRLQLINAFDTIRKIHESKESQQKKAGEIKKAVVIAEKITGSNLLEFFQSTYVNLTEANRAKLLERIGLTIIPDMLAGNEDRIIKPSYDEENGLYDWSDVASNLENLMVSDDGKLICIDNDIDPALKIESRKNSAYLTALKVLFSSKDFARQLTLLALKAIEDELTASGETAAIKAILTDLKKIGYSALFKGIQKMHDRLTNYFIPFWIKKQRAELEKSNKMLAATLTERLLTLPPYKE